MPFSQLHADIACNFFEKVLNHTADEWYGHPFLLAPWQEKALSSIFGNRDEAGNRLVSTVYIEVPKKTGKTELCAGIVLLVLALEQNPGAQVYSAAAATRQALNVYRAACKMVEQSPALRKLFRIARGTNRIMKRSDPDSFYAAIAADGDITDGVNPSCVIADELHRWKTRKQLENWDVLSRGGITRKEPLTIAITTAGVQSESPLAWRYHEKTRKIREGVFDDPKFFGMVYGAELTDDWTAEATWLKANPSLKQNGGFLDISKIRDEYTSSMSEPDGQVAFRRYFLNIWDQKENRAIDMKQWHACHRDWDAHGWPLPHDLEKRFLDRRCWVGVDLSMTTDLSAVVAVFERADGRYDLLPSCWMPAAAVRRRELQDGMPYSRWIQEGYLETSEGNVIDQRLIKARIRYLLEMFNVEEVCLDRYNTREISVSLMEDGIKCVEIQQNAPTLNEATKKLLKLVAEGKLVHGGHPILAHHASCLCTRGDGNDLVKPVKPDREKDSSRIDLLAAAIDAFVREIEAGTVAEYTGLRSVG